MSYIKLYIFWNKIHFLLFPVCQQYIIYYHRSLFSDFVRLFFDNIGLYFEFIGAPKSSVIKDIHTIDNILL